MDINYVPFVRYLVSNMEVKVNVEKLVSEIEHNISTGAEDPKSISAKNFGALQKLAREHNPERFENAKKNTLKGVITDMLSSNVVVTDNKIAQIVENLVRDRFFCIHVKRPGFGTNITSYWMEYMVGDQEDMREDEKPFLYKWYKHSGFPKSIDTIITKDISKVFEEMLRYYQEQAQKEKDNDGLKTIIFNLKDIIKKCGNFNNIENIKRRCIILLENSSAQISMDREKNLIGVYNGVLEFSGKDYRLWTTEKRFNISQTTDCRFVEFDPNNKRIKNILRILGEIIPDKLKMEGLLMHFSQIFVGQSCKRYFNIFESKGSGGKSILTELFKTMLGMRGSSGHNSNFGYYDTIESSAFMMEKMDVNGVDHHMMKLRGSLFTHAPEGKNNGVVQTHLIKKLRDAPGSRGMLESISNVDYEGIIVMMTNNPIKFSDYNYALTRRFLYMRFPVTFKPAVDIKEPTIYLRIIDESLEKKVKKKSWGEAFLSILVYYWKKLQTEYTHPEEMYKASGLLQETIDYLGEYNYIEKFVSKRLTKNRDSEIDAGVLHQAYVEWTKVNTDLRGGITMATARGDIAAYFTDDIRDGKLCGWQLVEN
jgi:phage/plasmid-associated DNA primase